LDRISLSIILECSVQWISERKQELFKQESVATDPLVNFTFTFVVTQLDFSNIGGEEILAVLPENVLTARLPGIIITPEQ
tara:strand:- start:411 stop:650 length:240 start_codon:yes stop_codon:yes gene_type:complete